MGIEIRGLTHSELQAHAELVYESYCEYVASGERLFLSDREWWLKSAQADPYYAPEQTRVAVVDGRLVAGVTNYTRDVYADGRVAKVSCIGSVCTHPDFRRQGLVRQVLEESIAWMERSGYDWSFLFGKEEVYGGSGWRILTSLQLVADLRPREDEGELLQVDPAGPDDIPALMGIYDYFNRTLTGPIVRNEAYWRQRVLAGRLGQTPVYHLLRRRGEPVGYFSGADGQVRELGWVDVPQDVFATLLRQWPGQPLRFSGFTSDMIRTLRQVTQVPSAAAYQEHAGGITLPETYRGLWRYIGDGCHCFPEITDTDSLLRFLREHEYNFWPVDGF